jgi:DNA-binding MarR family transcriptional regulator
MTPTTADEPLLDSDYRRLLAFRNELRAFTRWSEETARAAGLTPALHQLLLVVRGHPSKQGPTIGDAANALHIRHHSAVELAQRADASGLVERTRDTTDHRQLHLKLTAAGRARLEALTRQHLPRIRALADVLDGVCAPSRQSRKRQRQR